MALDWLHFGSSLANLGANLGLGIAGLEEQKKQNAFSNQMAEKNFNLQKEAYEYQKDLNSLQLQREDNAVQRRAEDLKMAGINPILAGGGSAVSQPLRAGSAPQREITNQSLDLSKLNALQMSQDFALKNLSASLQKKEAKRQDRIADSQIALNEANIGNVKALTDIAIIDRLFKTGSLSDRLKAESLKNEMTKQEMFKLQISNAISYLDAMNTFWRGYVPKGSMVQAGAALVDQFHRAGSLKGQGSIKGNAHSRSDKDFNAYMNNPSAFVKDYFYNFNY